MLTNQLSVIPQSVNHKYIPQQVDFTFLHSNLSQLVGKKVIFRTDFSREPLALQSFGSQKGGVPDCVREFSNHSRERIVVGIDSSCALVGEAEDGSIFAGRVTTVYRSQNGVQTYCRAGPIIFYLNYEWFSKSFGSSIPKGKLHAIISEVSVAERFVRIFLERQAQLQAAKSLSDAIIAIDGSLQRSTLESREISIHEVQRVASENLNELVGVSKTSNIREISGAAAALNALKRGSVFIDITDAIRAVSQRVGSNKIVAAKFSATAPVFRVDFSSSNGEDESQILADLKSNDVFFRGYPETLRLAHHLSVFDSSTISSIRSYLSRRYRLIQIPSDDLRATVLGKLV